MTKIFKQTLKFLFNCLLTAGLFISAANAMNLPLGWTSVGYALIFTVCLVVLLGIGEEDARYKGLIDGRNWQKAIDQFKYDIEENVNSGKDEFTVRLTNKIKPVELLRQKVFNYTHDIVYQITAISNCGTESELTFTKIQPHSDESKQLDQ